MLDEDKVTQPNILIHASDHKRETKRVISWGYDAFIKEIDLVEYYRSADDEADEMFVCWCWNLNTSKKWRKWLAEIFNSLGLAASPALQTEQSWAATRHVASLSRGRGIINNPNMNMNTLWAGPDMDTTTQKQIQSGPDCY